MLYDRTLTGSQIEAASLGADRPLLKPFNPEHLKAAAYDLSVGRQAWILRSREEGDPLAAVTLQDGTSVGIPSGHVALVETLEYVRLPRDHIGRVSLKNAQAVRQLSYHGGIVDPGFFGTLMLPIINLGQTEKRLWHGDPIASMQVVVLGTQAEIEEDDAPRGYEVLTEWSEGAQASQYVPVAELSERLAELEARMNLLGDREGLEQFKQALDYAKPRLEVQQAYMSAVVFGSAAGAIGAAILGSIELLRGEISQGWIFVALASLGAAIALFLAMAIRRRR